MKHLDHRAIDAFSSLKEYIYEHGISSMPKEAKERLYEIVEILKRCNKE